MTTQQTVIGEQQFDSTNTPSQPTRAQRALAAAQAAFATETERELFCYLEGCKGLWFVGWSLEWGRSVWSPSIDIAKNLIESVKGCESGTIDIAYRNFGSKYRTPEPSTIATERNVVGDLVEKLRNNPAANHCLIWHVPGETVVRFEHGPGVHSGGALSDLAYEVRSSVEMWWDFNFC